MKEGGRGCQIDLLPPPRKKLPLKSPALLGLKNKLFYKAMITNSMSFLHPRPLSDISNANGSFLIDSQQQTSVPYVFAAD